MTGISRYLVSTSCALLLGGCGAVRYPTNYILNFPPPAPRVQSASASLGPVAVRTFRCPDYICEGRIVYRPTPEQVAFYEYHRWAMDPRESITRLVADTLTTRSRFRQVVRPELRTRPEYVLTGSIDRLEEIDSGRDVRVICALSMQLTEAENGNVLWHGTATETLPVGERNVPGVVKQLSSAAQATVDQLLTSMTTHLAAASR
jgi:ABC-type uncharacterized transport system auxiliary subunit